MTSLSEFARRINEINGGKLDYKGAKRRLDSLGATVCDLKDPRNFNDLLAMCSGSSNIWKMYKDAKDRAKGTDPVLFERIKYMEFQNAEMRKAIVALNNVVLGD